MMSSKTPQKKKKLKPGGLKTKLKLKTKQKAGRRYLRPFWGYYGLVPPLVA
jgi:hypothetical protein